MKSSWFGAVFRHTRVRWTFMDPWGPRYVYVLYGHFSLIIPYLFFPYFFTKDFIIPYVINNHMRDSPHHHSIMYYFTPPIFACLVNILLLFIRTISPYFICINWVDTTLYLTLIWVLCSLSQHLFKSWNWLHCSLQVLLATIASDFLVLPLSPFIIIYIQIILVQDLHLLH